jgi:hypothetical protein
VIVPELDSVTNAGRGLNTDQASENTSQARQRQGGRGAPFPPGKVPQGARPWAKGQPSPNPGGRPKSQQGFRERCRDHAERLLERIMCLADSGGVGGELSDVVRAFEAVADRGGYLTADRQVAALLKALESPALTADDRRRVLDEICGPVAPSGGEP